jgi:hypothetical protein
VADKTKLEVYLELALSDFNKRVEEAKQKVAQLAQKVPIKFEFDEKSKKKFDDFFDQIKIGFKRRIGEAAFDSLTGLFQSAASQAQNLAQQIFEAGKATESLQSRLAQAVGGEAAGKQIFDELTKFAASTPLEIEEIVNAFISLKQRGVDPSIDSLTKLGDTAKSQGKSLQQFVEALLDAQTGENERLKEFGIQASKAGDQVTFSFNGVTRTVQATKEEIAEALISFGELPNVVGGMDRAAQTIEGRISTLSDAVKATLVTIFNGFKPAVSGGIDFLSKLAEATDTKLKESFLGLNIEAQEFANYLNENPQVIENIAAGIADLASSIASSLISGAKQLAGYLKENPQAIAQAVEGIKTFATQTANVVALVADLVSGIAKVASGIASIASKPNEIGQAIANNGGADFVESTRESLQNLLQFTPLKPVQDLQNELEKAKKETDGFNNSFGKLRQTIEGTAKNGTLRLSELRSGIKSLADESPGKTTKKTDKAAPTVDLKKNLEEIQKANASAEAAVKLSTLNQLAAIKQLGLAREEEARRIADLELNASTARVAAIQAEIAQIQQARKAGGIDPKAAADLEIKLNEELAVANLSRIEKVRAAEAALRAIVIKGIQEQAAQQKLLDNERVAAADRVLQSLNREQNLFSAKSGLEEAQGNLAKVRLENQLKIAEALGNESGVQQAKLQIQQQEVQNQERIFQAQLNTLDLSQKIRDAELQRQAVLDRIAVAEAEIALKLLSQKEGTTQAEIDLQKQVIAAQKEKAALTQQAITDQATLNQYAKEKLLTEQQATRETRDGAIVAEALKTNTGAIAQSFTAATQSAVTLSQSVSTAVSNAQALAAQAKAVQGAFQSAARSADGLVGSAPGESLGQQQAKAAAQGLDDEFEKSAFLFRARAQELRNAGLSSTERVNVGGATFDYQEAAQLFGEAASDALGGQVSEFAKTVLAQRIAVAQTGQTVLGNSLSEILKNTEELKRQKLVGFATGTSRPIRSGVALVGERGPELIQVTPEGTHVFNNSDTQKFLGGFASGTGSNLADSISAAKVAAEDKLNEILNRAYGRGSGLTFQSLGQISSVNDVARSILGSLDGIAAALSQGNLKTSQALALRAQRLDIPLSDFGIYRSVAEEARSVLGSFLNSLPKFERGTGSISNNYSISISDRPNPSADLTNALLSLSRSN